jgi:hypothetical protein
MIGLARSCLRAGAGAILLVLLFPLCHSQSMPEEYQSILNILGKSGDYVDHVFKINIPRNDLPMTVAGVETPTSFGFGGWLAMSKGNNGNDVMMGDLVLLQEEVNPVMSALLENGLEVTALHNHFFWEEPRIFYMHVHGFGKGMDLARKVKPALDLIGSVSGKIITPSVKKGVAEIATGKLSIEKLSSIIGHRGDYIGGTYKIVIGRYDIHLKEMGAAINARMGLNTWAAFIGTDDKAEVAGDIAMLENEVTPVLKGLRKNGLDVVAIHHHMTGISPMVIFLHFWGTGPAEKLAIGFRDALNKLGTATVGGSMHY